MKTRKKRLLSLLVCVAMLTAMVPMNVFAAETDGVGKHYEYNVNASDITPTTTSRGQVYNFTVPVFNDIGDTITINFKDVVPTGKNYSSYIKRSDVYCNNDAESLEYLKSMIDGGHPNAAQLATNLSNGYKNTILVSIPLYDQSNIPDCSYALKINNKLYKAENDSLVEITTPVAYPTLECISWNIDSHNSVLGTALPEKMLDNPATIVDMSQAQLNKISLQLYYKGNLVETYSLDNIYTNPIEFNKTFTYTMTYKLNTDGTVTATAPASAFVPPEATIQYTANAEYQTWGNKTSNDTDWIYNFTDANSAENIRVTSISANANLLQTTLNVTNIDTLKSIYDNTDHNPSTEDKDNNSSTEDYNPGTKPYIPPTEDKDNNSTTDNKENETTTGNNEETTTKDENTDVSTEVKDVTLTDDNKVISTDDMSILIIENATKDVVIKTPEGITLTFAQGTMKAVDGKDTYDFGVSISDDYSKQSNMGAVTNDNFVSLIDFNYSGNLPAEATVKIPVGADRAGQTLYYLQKVGTEYTLIQSAKVDDEGYITVKQDHCSTYVVATSDVSKDNSSDVNKETTTGVNEESSSDTQKETEKTPEKTSGSNNAIIYVIIVVIIIAIAGVAVFIVYKKKKTEEQNN